MHKLADDMFLKRAKREDEKKKLNKMRPEEQKFSYLSTECGVRQEGARVFNCFIEWTRHTGKKNLTTDVSIGRDENRCENNTP